MRLFRNKSTYKAYIMGTYVNWLCWPFNNKSHNALLRINRFELIFMVISMCTLSILYIRHFFSFYYTYKLRICSILHIDVYIEIFRIIILNIRCIATEDLSIMALVKIIIISVFYHVDAPRRWRNGLERMPRKRKDICL